MKTDKKIDIISHNSLSEIAYREIKNNKYSYLSLNGNMLRSKEFSGYIQVWQV